MLWWSKSDIPEKSIKFGKKWFGWSTVSADPLNRFWSFLGQKNRKTMLQDGIFLLSNHTSVLHFARNFQKFSLFMQIRSVITFNSNVRWCSDFFSTLGITTLYNILKDEQDRFSFATLMTEWNFSSILISKNYGILAPSQKFSRYENFLI